MDGIAAADHIQSFLDVPIIYLTGHSEAPFLKQAGTTAPYGYLVKPASKQELAATIQMALYRHAQDTKVKQSEQRFRSLFETSADSILLENQETDQVLEANPAACRLYGYSLEEFLALKITDVSAEPEKTEALVRRSVPEVPVRLHRKKDGTVFPVEIRGGYFAEDGLRLKTAFIPGITDRKKAEEQLLIMNFALQSSISAIGNGESGRQGHLCQRFISPTLGLRAGRRGAWPAYLRTRDAGKGGGGYQGFCIERRLSWGGPRQEKGRVLFLCAGCREHGTNG